MKWPRSKKRPEHRLDLQLDWREDNYQQRLARLHRRSQLVIQVGVALATFLVVVASGDAAAGVYEDAPKWLRAVVFTLLVIAGGSLAFAYIRYEWTATKIQRGSDAEIVRLTDSAGDYWPYGADRGYYIALVFTIAAPVVFMVAVWWPVW